MYAISRRLGSSSLSIFRRRSANFSAMYFGSGLFMKNRDWAGVADVGLAATGRPEFSQSKSGNILRTSAPSPLGERPFVRTYIIRSLLFSGSRGWPEGWRGIMLVVLRIAS